VILTKRQLNRALLARQMLLTREKLSVVAAVERLVAMQAQVPRPPFVGLWARLQEFKREDLLRPLRQRKLVRATAIRGTLHLLSTKDYLAFRPVIAAALAKGADSIVRKRMGGVDVEALLDKGRVFFGTAPAPFESFRDLLEKDHPMFDIRAMAYTVRMGVPLVMVPDDSLWGFPASAGFTLAEKWLGEKIAETSSSLEVMVLRYLAASGPATPGDAQTWSGIGGLRETFEKLRAKLVTFRDERKRELFDLPKAPRPDEDTPAPVRFLPEFDNILLSHDDRSRIISSEHRPAVFLKNLQVLGTFLVDGFVAGTWKMERKKSSAALNLKAFAAIPKKTLASLEEEGESLLTFLEPDTPTREVRVTR
jgi:winged helix DNA-binding protein